MVKNNDEYSPKDFETMGLALEAVHLRVKRGLSYGPDMASSRAACLEDIRKIVERAFEPGVAGL